MAVTLPATIEAGRISVQFFFFFYNIKCSPVIIGGGEHLKGTFFTGVVRFAAFIEYTFFLKFKINTITGLF